MSYVQTTAVGPVHLFVPLNKVIMSSGTIAGIAIGVVLGVLVISLVTGLWFWRGQRATARNGARSSVQFIASATGNDTREETGQLHGFAEPNLSSGKTASVKDPLVSISSATDSTETARTKSTSKRRKVWPQDASRPRQNKSSLALDIGTDVVLLLLSACFFCFAVLAVFYHEKAVRDRQATTDRLMSAARIGPSVFPILFAAVLGRLIKSLMNWRLEHGVKLGFLDLLAGSTSAANTILTQFHLGLPSLVGLALIVAWAFSPLGGQATLRVLSFREVNTLKAEEILYMTNNATYSSWFMGSLGNLQTLAFGLFNAALLGPARVKQSPVDTWNNFKIPMIEHISTDRRQRLNNTWLDVPDSDSVVYSSLIGIPLSTLPSDTRSNLQLEASYLTLNCPELKAMSWDEVNYNGSFFGNTTGAAYEEVTVGMFSNSTKPLNEPCYRDDPHNTTISPRFAAYYFWSNVVDDTQNMFGALCSIQTTYVEVDVICDGSNCKAARIRDSTLANPVSSWTLFDGQPGSDCTWWNYYMNLFLKSVPVPRSATPSPLQGYLGDPNAPTTTSSTSAQKFTDLDRAVFADRLAQLLNSFMLILAGPYAVTNGIDDEGVEGSNASAAATTLQKIALTYRSFKIIVCDPAWLTVLALASTFLLAAGIMTIVLRTKLRIPELALNWSTVIRDNPNVPGSDTGCLLDDLQRSRLLKETSLMIGDVASDREVGHLAIGSVDGDDTMSRIRADRLYY